MLVVNRDGPAYLLMNRAVRGNWVRFRVLTPSGRDAHGATVSVNVGGLRVHRDVQPAASYFASNDPRVHFGLGDHNGGDGCRRTLPGRRRAGVRRLRGRQDVGTAPATLTGSARRLLFAALVLAIDASADVRFVDATDESSLDFTHLSGMTGELWTLEIIGAGAGILDYDGDGRLDVWLVQGGPLVGRGTARLPSDRLFRNVGDLTFLDVTETAGIAATGYGMGIATADVDNDGDTDVFLANYGPNELWLNVGDGRFRDATADSGIAGERWSISASFADVDGDGLLDLYVANYLDFRIDTAPPCRAAGQRSYCPPSRFAGVRDRLYRNLGGGRFPGRHRCGRDRGGTRRRHGCRRRRFPTPTVTSTSTSPTMEARTCCGSTTAPPTSRTRRCTPPWP